MKEEEEEVEVFRRGHISPVAIATHATSLRKILKKYIEKKRNNEPT